MKMMQKVQYRWIDEVKETTGKTADVTLADSGYATSEQLSEASEKQYKVLLNITEKLNIPTGPRKDAPYHVSNFTYDENKDVMICPESKELKYFESEKSKNKKHRIRKYKCKILKGARIGGSVVKITRVDR